MSVAPAEIVSNRRTNVPELLCPAGEWEAMRAAVANGADAVYFGLSAFNARHRAANFSVEELPEVMRYLHGHNVRGYVTLNVLIFSDELEEAARHVRAIADAGVDAVIVQDLGLAKLISRLCPTLAVHGSTQMTLTEPMGVDFVRRLGVSRAILARELSVAEIGNIAKATPMSVEVFVHGALCVSYSGQCLTSEALGGRSANRGQCAQACRLPYELVVDGEARDLGGRDYLLSPQDLAAHDLVGELAEAGVCCLKIEGRLKSAQYVAATTQTYRDAVDAFAKGHAFIATPQQELDLAQSFSRGFTHGFLDGPDHQALVHARFPKSRGVAAGEVIGKIAGAIVVRLNSGATLKVGDGIVFDEGHPDQDEQGGRITRVTVDKRRKDVIEVSLYAGEVSLAAISVGSIVWKTDDPEIRRRLQRSYGRDRVVSRRALAVDVEAAEGAALRIRVSDDAGHRAAVKWEGPLQRAQKFPATRQLFVEQFGRLGDTPFELGEVRLNGDPQGEFPPVMIPKSVLNDLRRQATAELLAQRATTRRHQITEPDALESMRDAAKAMLTSEVPGFPRLHVLVRTIEQLQAAIDWKSPSGRAERGMVYCDFEDVRKYSDAVKLARSAGIPIGLATVRIIKPSEHGLLRTLAAAQPDAVLVRNLAGLSYFRSEHPNLPVILDYSLNVANELTAAIFAAEGVRRMTPSYDLNWKQLSAVVQRFDASWFEAVVHQQMPMFHTEHCVFANTLSKGRDFRDCGRPCDQHRVELRDRAGVAHPLIADVGCRNTVYNGTAQSGAEYVPRMLELGIRHFRIEMVRESAKEGPQLLDRYARILAGLEDGRNTWRQLKVLNQLGVTRGTLE
jgi:putative protease